MFPPSQSYNLDVEAISGICGSVSIACWVVVFSPQIVENFRRSSAEGLSVEFVIIWLLGDFANIIGSVLQKVLPTMIILAVYYTFADIVLLAQCFYYRGFQLRDPKPAPRSSTTDNERAPLLANGNGSGTDSLRPRDQPRASSVVSIGERFHSQADVKPPTPSAPRPVWVTVLVNGTAILVVVAAGVCGWFLSPAAQRHDNHPIPDDDDTSLDFSLWGQIFGYLCAVLYLGSRVPQLLLNYRRKSTEGLNALFFLFACIGNLTYVLSIFAWLLGSLGTLFLDMAVFVQFFLYKDSEDLDRGRSLEEEEEQ
ncbi:hypothetical protein ANO11243_018610 [Dothideomycetidae sp. 11243]|nr:hypothetical protein ANO11243_018610 [fungal sp. No.11243]